MKKTTTQFQEATIDDLYEITLASTRAKSGEVFIFEKGSLVDLVGFKKAETLRKEFLKNNVKVKQITNSPTLPKFSENNEFINTVMSFRYVPKDIFDTEYEICIFDDTVAFYSTEKILVIKDSGYAHSQKKLFLSIWDQGQSPQLDFEYTPQHSYYNCFKFSHNGIPIIVWPDLDAKVSFAGMKRKELEKYIGDIFDENAKEYEGLSYVIAFIWSMDGEKMLDTWRFTSNYVDERSGPLGDNIVYRSGKRDSTIEIASGSTLVILGYEEKLRRQSSNLQDYLSGPVPQFPLEIVNGKNFF